MHEAHPPHPRNLKSLLATSFFCTAKHSVIVTSFSIPAKRFRESLRMTLACVNDIIRIFFFLSQDYTTYSDLNQNQLEILNLKMIEFQIDQNLWIILTEANL